MRVLGVDPGMSGGMAIYAPAMSTWSCLRWQLIELPTVGEGSQRRIDAAALREWIMRFSPEHAFVEWAAAYPKQGVTGAFRYGRAAGALDAVIACCGVPITYIHPLRWKRFHNLKGSNKELSRARALQLAPELAKDLPLKKDHGKAEAALIAMYGAHCLAPISPV